MTSITTSTLARPASRRRRRQTSGEPGTPATPVPPGSPRVPWSTVLPLAVPLAFAATFWIVALRTSLGAIERTGTPQASWVRESLVALPCYVLAVLAALALAQRRWRRDPEGVREVALTGLLVTSAATLVAVGQLALSSTYDYRLQSAQATQMSSMDPSCGAACESAVGEAILALQERAVIVGAGIVLLTNVVLVAWVVAARGGRVRLLPPDAGPRRPAAAPSRLAGGSALLAATLVGSAAIHAAVVGEHLREWRAAGVFFGVLTAVELALAAAVVVRRAPPSRRLLQVVVAASVLPLSLWLVSRSLGLPVGPETWQPEPVGLADLAASSLELLTVAVAVAAMSARRGARVLRPGHGVRLCLVLVVAITALGLGGTEVAWASLRADSTSSAPHH